MINSLWHIAIKDARRRFSISTATNLIKKEIKRECITNRTKIIVLGHSVPHTAKHLGLILNLLKKHGKIETISSMKSQLTRSKK